MNLIETLSRVPDPRAKRGRRYPYNSEIAVVQAMLEALDLQGVLLSLDSLHCQKKQSN
jgi:hypothetical protein